MTDTTADDPSLSIGRAEPAVRIRTGSRLHFGLLDTVDPFGGVGVMVDSPATTVIVSKSDQFRCDDVAVDRVRGIAERIAANANLSALPACSVQIVERVPSHCGMGSGTQISLAVAEGIGRVLGMTWSRTTLVREIASRGLRSAVGSHGYFSGGLVFEAPDPMPEDVSEETSGLNAPRNRVSLPAAWRVVVLQPRDVVATVSGDSEVSQFANLRPADPEAAAELRRIVTQEIVPAAERADFVTFTSAVHRYNERSGRLFESVQGGPYNGQHVTEVIEWLVDRGVQGVGQSSWGPGVFAWFESAEEAASLTESLPDSILLRTLTSVRNDPRTIQVR